MYKKDLVPTYYIIKDGKVLGRCSSYETAYKVCFVKRAASCCVYNNLLQLEDDWLYQLYTDHVGELPPPPMHVEEMASRIFAAMEKAHFPVASKPSCKELLRAMFEHRSHWSKKEIQEMITKVKWQSVRTAMSDLKHENMNIKHEGNGQYVRQ